MMTKKHRAKLLEYGLQDIGFDFCECLHFDAGEKIMEQGMPITWLGIVVSGSAKACSMTANGKNLVLCYYVSEGMVGDIEFMAQMETVTATLIALTDFECIMIPYNQYVKDLTTNVNFLNKYK